MRVHADAVEQAAVDALALRVAKAVDARGQVGLQRAASLVRAPRSVPRVAAVAREEGLRLLVVFAHIAAKLRAVRSSRAGDGQDIRAHGEGDFDKARRVLLVFNRQLDHAALDPVGNILAAHDVQHFLLHAVMKGSSRRVLLAGVRRGERHVVDGEEETVADLLLPRPKAAHLARHGVAHVREEAALRADQYGVRAGGDGRRVHLVITIDPVLGEHGQTSLCVLRGPQSLITAMMVETISRISAIGEISRRYFIFSSILSGMILSIYILSGSSLSASRSFSFR